MGARLGKAGGGWVWGWAPATKKVDASSAHPSGSLLSETIRQLRDKRQRRETAGEERGPRPAPEEAGDETEERSEAAGLEPETETEDPLRSLLTEDEEEDSADLFSDATCNQVHSEIFLESLVEGAGGVRVRPGAGPAWAALLSLARSVSTDEEEDDETQRGGPDQPHLVERREKSRSRSRNRGLGARLLPR